MSNKKFVNIAGDLSRLGVRGIVSREPRSVISSTGCDDKHILTAEDAQRASIIS